MKRLFKQLYGRFRLLAQHLSFYAMMVTMVSAVITMWVTALAPWLIDKGIDPKLWMLVLAILFIFAVGVMFEYNVTFPSFYATWNEQMWKHDSPIKEEFKKLNKRIDELAELIEKNKNATS